MSQPGDHLIVILSTVTWTTGSFTRAELATLLGCDPGQVERQLRDRAGYDEDWLRETVADSGTATYERWFTTTAHPAPTSEHATRSAARPAAGVTP